MLKKEKIKKLFKKYIFLSKNKYNIYYKANFFLHLVLNGLNNVCQQ